MDKREYDPADLAAMMEGAKSWTPNPEDGFGYRAIARLLGPDCILPVLAVITRDAVDAAKARGDTHLTWHLAGVIRGKGKTYGYHERNIEIPIDVAEMIAFDSYSHYLAHKIRQQKTSAYAQALQALVDKCDEAGFDIAKIAHIEIVEQDGDTYAHAYASPDDAAGV